MTTEHRAAICLDMARSARLGLAVAESCSGGMIGAALTAIPGASSSFLGGVICYADAVKRQIIGVEQGILDRHGAVSEQTACSMALGVARLFSADLSVAVTGIAGPQGGSEDKPLGLVHIAACRGERIEHRRYLFEDSSRSEVRHNSVNAALDLLCFMMR